MAATADNLSGFKGGSSANLLDVHLQKEEVAVKVVYL